MTYFLNLILGVFVTVGFIFMMLSSPFHTAFVFLLICLIKVFTSLGEENGK